MHIDIAATTRMDRVICLLVFATITTACPRIISRAEWGARDAKTSFLTTYPPTHVLIHHAASSFCSSQSKCSAMVRSFQNMHIDQNGWDDIGYNFLVDGAGVVYEGRGWGKTGAHAPKYNSMSIGICFIGTFISSLPSRAALNAAQELIQCGVDLGEIRGDYLLAGHRQVTATECPGQALFGQITTWSHWTANP